MNKYLATLVVLSAVQLGACGGDSAPEDREKAMEQAAAAHGIKADVRVSADGSVDKVVIDGPGGGRTGKNLDLPSGFPDDVAVGDDWDIMMTSPIPSGGFSLQASSSEDSAALSAYLKEQMQAAGWTLSGEQSTTPMMHTVGFEKGARIANFNLMSNADKTHIQLATMDKP